MANYQINRYYKKSYNRMYNGNYSYQEKKRVRWRYALLTFLFSTVLIGSTAYFTNNFYSDNVQAWDMTYGWYCPGDGNVYAKNYNALVSRENYAVMKAGKALTVYADFEKAEKIEVNERLYVKYSVIYYNGDTSVGQSIYYNLPFDLNEEAGNSPIIWSYEEASKDPEFVALEVDSIKLAVVYEYLDDNITLSQKSTFSNVFMLEY